MVLKTTCLLESILDCGIDQFVSVTTEPFS